MSELYDRIMSVTATRLRNSYSFGLVSLIFYKKFLGGLVQVGSNLFLSPLDAKDIREYVFWRGVLGTVSFV